ncbi:uncharacterized protein C8A04DRAFT_24903 [Dichotomopilus funicola]|uniref:DNA polymerase n=1 Tax=Dichotomopilus funicola TaxID=1934379 RepID=A0AAN6V968_9PEZI|nr:hypothetical protein C8A04DRAFT_24903 [Dichotomopilus funicola]
MTSDAGARKRSASHLALAFPTIFLLSAHLSSDELQDLEGQIPTLTYDINEAEVVLGKVFRKERALFELRKHHLATEEVLEGEAVERREVVVGSASVTPTAGARKRTKMSTPTVLGSSDIDSDTASEGDVQRHPVGSIPAAAMVKVVKLCWFTDSVAAGEVLPITEKYLIYRGYKKTPEPMHKTSKGVKLGERTAADVIKRALADADTALKHPSRSPRSSQKRRGETYVSHPLRPPRLLKQTTSERELERQMPPVPKWLHSTYSCQRPTLVHPPNEGFIEELAKIKTARVLMGDKVGVRAYSSAIATIAAYPYTIQTAQEIARLPGCGTKIAMLFQEFKDSGNGQIREAREDETDPKLAVLKLFYDIWGVAETTARDFYNRGWRDLDDIVEFGWDSLTRVQQIGVKFYDEFKLKIPRAEVEAIGETVRAHANAIVPGFQMVIVGGYRRGKLESGDVDIVLSHPDENATRDFVGALVVALERTGCITHTLSLSTANSERGQAPVSWKGNGPKTAKAGAGFDTLDKAMVVWQDPVESGENDGEAKRKNPKPHRRVDIIISPWKTAGCAVLGWSSGTTFQRDLRRYCKYERLLKFDSSGIRSRRDGRWVDLESAVDGTPAPDMLTAEKRVFEGLGLEWRPPEERCTG